MGRLVTIGISKEVWKELNGEKRHGESFDKTLRRVLGLSDIQKVEETHRKKDLINTVYIKNSDIIAGKI